MEDHVSDPLYSNQVKNTYGEDFLRCIVFKDAECDCYFNLTQGWVTYLTEVDDSKLLFH